MTENKAESQERIKWFHQARFGMFVHWGLYSLLGRGEWVMLQERIRSRDYARIADRFNPARFDADAWAKLAVGRGWESTMTLGDPIGGGYIRHNPNWKTAYLHMFHYPGTEAVVPMVASRVRSAELMGTGPKLKVRMEYNGRMILSGLPPRPPHPAMNTIKVRFAETPRIIPYKKADQPAWLEGRL